MVNYIEAFKRPFQDKWIFLRAAIPIYNFAVFGYILECIRNTSQGNNKLADWKSNGWFNKIFSPIGAGIVIFLFFILPFLIPGILIYWKKEVINNLIPYSSYVLLGILGFFMSYYSLVSFISYIKNWKLEDISYRRINTIAFTKKYFINWFIAEIFLLIFSVLQLLEIPHLNWFNMILIWVLYLPAWTIIAEAVREIEIDQNI